MRKNKTESNVLGNENAVQELIQNGADVNQGDENGNNALHFSANNGKSNVLFTFCRK